MSCSRRTRRPVAVRPLPSPVTFGVAGAPSAATVHRCRRPATHPPPTPGTVTLPVTPSMTSVTPSGSSLRPHRTVPVPVDALAALAGAAVPPSSAMVTGVALRASQVRPGDLFAALPSVRPGRPHGADFAAYALAAGAAAVLTDGAGAARAALAGVPVPVLVHPDPRAALGPLSARIHGDPSTRLAVLGVTGTSGKTTTTHLLEAGLRVAGASTGLLGTVESRIGAERLPS